MTDVERPVAEQAVATLRPVRRAGDDAPRGKCLYRLGQAVHDHGLPSLRDILRRSLDVRTKGRETRG